MIRLGEVDRFWEKDRGSAANSCRYCSRADEVRCGQAGGATGVGVLEDNGAVEGERDEFDYREAKRRSGVKKSEEVSEGGLTPILLPYLSVLRASPCFSHTHPLSHPLSTGPSLFPLHSVINPMHTVPFFLAVFFASFWTDRHGSWICDTGLVPLRYQMDDT